MCLLRDQLLAQNFDAVLAVIVKFAGDCIFAKFLPRCSITHFQTPHQYILQVCTGDLGLGMGGDGVRYGQWGAGNDICARG